MMTNAWLIWALLAAGFAAASAVVAKVALAGMDSDLATLIRTSMMLPMLALFIWLMGKWPAWSALPPRKAMGYIALSGLAGAASWICYFRAISHGRVSQVASVDKLSVVIVAILAVAFLGEHLSWRGWTGVALIAIGGVLMAIEH